MNKPASYILNQVMQSPLTGTYYFVAKARRLDNGVCQVVGKKVDVTESIEALFGDMLKRERARALSPKRPTKARKARR